MVAQLPCRQPARPGYWGRVSSTHTCTLIPLVVSQIYRRQGRAVIDTCQPAGVAMGQDIDKSAPFPAAYLFDKRQSVFTLSFCSSQPHRRTVPAAALRMTPAS
ncbi:MAG: hypothetical protein MZV63_12815 [Marinilabiliales bacterium]|nr:hypothetical protein [Marinilabiliales bacterium]